MHNDAQTFVFQTLTRGCLEGGDGNDEQIHLSFSIPLCPRRRTAAYLGPAFGNSRCSKYHLSVSGKWDEIGSKSVSVSLTLKLLSENLTFLPLQRWTDASVVKLGLRVTCLFQPVNHFYYLSRTCEYFSFYIMTYDIIMQKCRSYDYSPLWSDQILL